MKTPGKLPVICGVAGWSYPDWAGVVYPPGLKDKLEFLSRYVDLIEINATFYRPPSARNSDSWVRRTAQRPSFRFSAKLHQDVTHKQRIEEPMVREFHDGLRPLREAGKLSHLLAQFRYDFTDSPANRQHVRAVRDAFGDIAQPVIEVRHNSWQSPAALEFLAGLDLTVANLDYPYSRDAFTLRECRVGTTGYLRLHGRNRAAWFDKKAGRDETYNYLYGPEEIQEIKKRVLDLVRSYRALTVVANNHFRGKELANILELKNLLEGEPVPVPSGLLKEYPRLAAIAAPLEM